jgi:hypothetical protein
MGEIRYLEFGPYWNVPGSILRKEILPRLAKDASYLAREQMEIVATPGGAVLAPDAAAIEALRSGTARLRQRPGPGNALGGVKFGIPNKFDVYLHATPATQLFERSRRDFSHGCIRVRDPLALARFALVGRPEWSPEAIETAASSYVNRTVALSQPVAVLVVYSTAIVDSEGRARFLPDIYGHDRKRLREMQGAGLPAPHVAGIEVDESRGGIEADAARPQRDRGIAQAGQGHVRQPDVDRPSLEVQAVRGHSASARLAEHLVRGGRAIPGDHLEGRTAPGEP